MKKTIGIFAHVDAGKTTFSEQLLYQTKSIKTIGRVDKKTSFLDTHEIEKERGITIFSDVGMFSYKDSSYYLIDTPGHVDFSPEMERAIQVLDYAMIIVSASEGIESHTETVWQLLRKHQIPVFFFINKIDRVGSDATYVLNELQTNFSKHIFDLSTGYQNEKMSMELIEFIAEKDELLLEIYFNGKYDEKLWVNELKKMIKAGNVYPCRSGSALQNIGILEFFNEFDKLSTTDYQPQLPFKGRVFKVRHDVLNVRMTYVKALSGELNVRDTLTYEIDGKQFIEKVTQIKMVNGKQMNPVDRVEAGDVFVVYGLTNAISGTGFGCDNFIDYQMIPTLKSKVIFDDSLNTKDVYQDFKLLEAEDPSLHVMWEHDLKEIDVHVMGIIQLEVLVKIIEQRFGYQVSFAEPEILYLETIDEPVSGYGHYEPLRHYAEVHLKIEPGKRGSGICVASTCHPNSLSTGLQNTILHYLTERKHHGILTGSYLTDLKITLLNGLDHYKHTSGGDFKEATLRALRQGLEKAKNRLLEPYYDFKIKVELNHLGRVISDIEMESGTFHPPQILENKAIIEGRVPVSTFMDYQTTLQSYTQGKGTLHLTFSGYDYCHNEQEMIDQKAYDKNADLAYPSSSVFCAKGGSFVVKWDEAELMMHGLKK